MRYFIDTEFDGFQGPLISMALVREDGAKSLYFILEGAEDTATDPWVLDHVLPILKDSPEPPWVLSRHDAAGAIQLFLSGDDQPVVVADWPDDLRHFCDLVVFGPGKMIGLPRLSMEVVRIDAYDHVQPGVLTQHNAWCDAVALRQAVMGAEEADPAPQSAL